MVSRIPRLSSGSIVVVVSFSRSVVDLESFIESTVRRKEMKRKNFLGCHPKKTSEFLFGMLPWQAKQQSEIQRKQDVRDLLSVLRHGRKPTSKQFLRKHAVDACLWKDPSESMAGEQYLSKKLKDCRNALDLLIARLQKKKSFHKRKHRYTLECNSPRRPVDVQVDECRQRVKELNDLLEHYKRIRAAKRRASSSSDSDSEAGSRTPTYEGFGDILSAEE